MRPASLERPDTHEKERLADRSCLGRAFLMVGTFWRNVQRTGNTFQLSTAVVVGAKATRVLHLPSDILLC